jgi:alanine racemase
MSLSLDQIVKITRGSLLKTGLSNDVHELAYDSRRITLPHRAAFFALRTAGRDGVDYIDAVYQAGVRTFVVHHDFFPDKRWFEGSFVAVDDTLRALQDLAAAHRQQFNIPVIGITGSNGKTIVKDWLSWLLEPELRVCRSPKSYNSQLGLAISLWQLEAGDQLGIFEAGISERDEMARLEAIMKPEIGIFTHLGDAHAEHFASPSEKITEKFKLFQNVKRLVVRLDDPQIHQAVEALQRIL